MAEQKSQLSQKTASQLAAAVPRGTLVAEAATIEAKAGAYQDRARAARIAAAFSLTSSDSLTLQGLKDSAFKGDYGHRHGSEH